MTQGHSLKLVSYNTWHGLTGRGFLYTTGFQTAAERRRRFQQIESYLETLTRSESISVLCLQELSPVRRRSLRIAERIRFDEAHQVANSGMKIFGFGLPINFSEGIATLAAPSLHLNRLFSLKLPTGHVGFNSDFFSFQYAEHRYALFCEVMIAERPILLVNTHLHHCFGWDPLTCAEYERLPDNREKKNIAAFFTRSQQIRMEQIKAILREIDRLAYSEIIVCGDLNTIPGTEEFKKLEAAGFCRVGMGRVLNTYDGNRNPFCKLEEPDSLAGTFPCSKSTTAELFDRLNRTSRQIDHLFFRGALREVSTKINEDLLSDHFPLITHLEANI